MSGLPAVLADFEAAARDALDPGAYGYVAGGATDEVTLADNVAAWQRIRLLPRVLRGVDAVDTSVSLLGTTLPHPVIAAPMAYQRILTPDGEVAMARAAAATGTIACQSTLSTVPPADVAAAVPGGRRWYQVYVFRDRGLTDALIAAALAVGCEALVVTVDFPVSGLRERDARSGFRVAAEVPAVAAAGTAGAFQPHQTGAIFDPSLTWADVAALAARHRVPLLVKGVLRADDAVRALDSGAAGVVVSNHGGRQLDGSLATADALPGVVEAVAGRAPVVVDGGIRRGADVLRALALGAAAVMVGRPLAWGLAVGGAAGAERVLELLIDELRSALILCGTASAAHLDAGLLHLQ